MTVLKKTWNDKRITTFVRSGLGCGCPDKVFEKIERETIAKIGNIEEISRIVIGDTLLIYVVRPLDWGTLQANITSLVSSGTSDRDGHNYNRFRLVVAVANPVDTQEQMEAKRLFDAAVVEDAKLHLHFMSLTELEGL